MKAGVRALGIAESYDDSPSTVAGAVVRRDAVLDEVIFGQWTVGGTDATATVVDLVDRLDRPDVRYVLLAGIAPAWYNVLDLPAIAGAVDRPTISVSFEGSSGLAGAIRDAFDDEAVVRDRLATYRAQPERRGVAVDDATLYVRHVGCPADEADEVVRAFTHEGDRPEPLRAARIVARAADRFRDDLAG